MQLEKNIPIAAALAAATCALLGAPNAKAEESQEPWAIDTAILYYGETDRVSVVEGVLNASKDFGDEHIFNGKLVLDTLTGASASGAVAQPGVQSFTRPSGKGSYEVNGGETPLDDTFQDTRVQVSGQWTQPLWENTRGSSGLNFSKEYDYLSIGANGSIAKDFDRKNRTLSLGLSYQYDSIDPVGGAPVPFSNMLLRSNFDSDDGFDESFADTRQDGSQDKTTIDVLLGLTQTINKRMIMQLNYGLSVSDGYLNDPYKILSLVNEEGLTESLVYENRPDKRTKHNIYWQTKYAMDSSVIDVSYRFSTDDWDINSHTIDSRLRFNLSDTSYIQPHFRYYQQEAAEFYTPFLNSGDSLPTYASSDYRLGEMTAVTLGLKYGQILSNGHEWGVRLEYYQQSPKNSGFDAPGTLQNEDLYPSVKAVIAQLSYSF
ncbi:DUF3570 domain-containing protein [Paraglaciecola marina]|uniref:DUF3570 domain-containing protein n=1 Tax=Paraglaciecola marina TaxID=2500157 RepID=UPI00105B9582|nr:DUF3570 domain-containing protein [Paraglaciecola marina]